MLTGARGCLLAVGSAAEAVFVTNLLVCFPFSLYCFSLSFVPGKVIGVGVVGQCGTSVRFNEQEGYGKCFHQCT